MNIRAKTERTNKVGQRQYYFLGVTLDEGTRSLRRGEETLPLGGRAFDLLLYLIDNRDRIVSRAEVFRGVWGDAVLDQSNLNVQLAALRRVLGADIVQTVPRRGLRFGVDVEGASDAETASIAVLRFDVIGQAEEIEWLADGIAEDLSTELARFRDLIVIARNSARTLSRGTAQDAALALNARYLVAGTLRQAGGTLRLTVRLVDSNSGVKDWAETYDCAADARFEMVDEIVAALASAIGPQVWAAEARRLRREPPRNISAHDLAQQAWAGLWPLEMTPDQGPRDRAMDLAKQAIGIDPSCALAHRTIAYAQYWTLYFGLADPREAAVMAGLTAAAEAIASDPLDHHAYRQKGLLHFLSAEPVAGMIDLRRAHTLNPNCALTLSWLGLYEATHGNDLVAVGHAEAALTRSPLDPMRTSLEVALAFTRFITADYPSARDAAFSAVQQRPQAATPYLILAIARIGAGDLGGAKTAYQQLETLAPEMATARLDGAWLSPKEDYRRRAQTFLRVAAGLAPMAEAAALVTDLRL
ncbi:MAG: winged helix-turn-helix domain-containing protein [Pseudomonadota bacterium]